MSTRNGKEYKSKRENLEGRKWFLIFSPYGIIIVAQRKQLSKERKLIIIQCQRKTHNLNYSMGTGVIIIYNFKKSNLVEQDMGIQENRNLDPMVNEELISWFWKLYLFTRMKINYLQPIPK